MAGTDLETPVAKAGDSRGSRGAGGGTHRAKPSLRAREKSSSTRGAQDEKFAAG